MPTAADLDAAIAPLREDRAHAAILSDVDGTLAPIVRHAGDAHVPEPTRGALLACADEYGLVACVSGRRAAEAKRIVGLGQIPYLGNHGTELLPALGGDLQVDAEVDAWTARVHAFADDNWGADLRRLRVRREDKHSVIAVHWRGVPDEEAAQAAVAALAVRAQQAGLATHHGRKVLELRPPVPMDKGRGIAWLLRGTDVRAALYCGDDHTDIDAFRGLRAMVDDDRLASAVCVGVRSDEMPPELGAEADVLVDGTEGVRGLLRALAA